MFSYQFALVPSMVLCSLILFQVCSYAACSCPKDVLIPIQLALVPRMILYTAYSSQVCFYTACSCPKDVLISTACSCRKDVLISTACSCPKDVLIQLALVLRMFLCSFLLSQGRPLQVESTTYNTTFGTFSFQSNSIGLSSTDPHVASPFLTLKSDTPHHLTPASFNSSSSSDWLSDRQMARTRT